MIKYNLLKCIPLGNILIYFKWRNLIDVFFNEEVQCIQLSKRRKCSSSDKIADIISVLRFLLRLSSLNWVWLALIVSLFLYLLMPKIRTISFDLNPYATSLSHQNRFFILVMRNSLYAWTLFLLYFAFYRYWATHWNDQAFAGHILFLLLPLPFQVQPLIKLFVRIHSLFVIQRIDGYKERRNTWNDQY